MTALSPSTLPTPHGGKLNICSYTPPQSPSTHSVDLTMTPKQRADLEMIAIGGYSPLSSFMGSDEYDSVISHMRLPTGELWPIPITFQLPERPDPKITYLRLFNDDRHVATLEIAGLYDLKLQDEALAVFGTDSLEHPGVASLYRGGSVAVWGHLSLHQTPRTYEGVEYYTPLESRAYFEDQHWKTVVAFQTRNPVHRAHEYLHKVALEMIDGLFLNPLVGETKGDDVPSEVRMDAYRVLLEHYYPTDRVLLGVYPAAMRYAGPKEAILHALSRKNYGCTHFIVGRDHAGVGTYYGTYAAQEIFDDLDPTELGIQILKFEHSFFCQRCEQVVSTRTCPHDSSFHLALSGTKVREILSNGQDLPKEFSRPEVAAVLMKAYARKDA